MAIKRYQKIKQTQQTTWIKRMKAGISTMLVLTLLAVTLSMPTYADTPSGWATEAIEGLQAQNLLRASMFDDYKTNITRLDYAYLVYKLVESYGISMSDISDLNASYTLTDCDDYYVIACFKAGIITGYPDKTYRPTQPITRQEICTLYMKALETVGVSLSDNDSALVPFQDASEMGSWARDSIIKCLDNGIINGTSATTLSPLGYSTVEQSLVIFDRIINNATIGSQVVPTQKDLRPSAIAFEAGITYYVNKDLTGSYTGVKRYHDFELMDNLMITDMNSGIMVHNGFIFYINLEDALVRLDPDTGSVFLIETRACSGFTISGDMLYAIYDGDVYTHSLLGGVVGTSSLVEDLVGHFVSISYYHNQLGSSQDYLFLMTDEDELYRYHDEALSFVSPYALDFRISDNEIYVLDSLARLKSYGLNSGDMDQIAENVQNFGVCGRNVLYITNDGALYNNHRGILGSRLYQGDLAGLALDYNYLEITEGLIGDSEFNHLVALFYMREYFGN